MIDVLEEKRVDGVIVAAPRTSTDDLLPVLARHPYAVIVNRLFSKPEAATVQAYVINDDKAGGYAITNHFLDQGHTAIGFLAGPKKSYGSMRRMEGYRKALDEYGLEYNPEIVRYCIPTVEGGREIASQLIQENPEISALFCYNDLVAIGVLQCCHKLGKRIPDDLAIFGYDDIPMASWVTPSLSTCRVNFEQMGREATKLLISHISECPGDCTNIVMQPRLIIRDSAP
jgi:LacI family transcriptional regulator